MIRYIGDGGSELEAELCALCVCLGQIIKIVEGCGEEVVNSVLGDIVPCKNDCCDCNGGNIIGSAVDVLCDGVFLVVGAHPNELCNMLCVKADEVNLTADRKVGDCGGGCACNDEGCVDLAVLQTVCGVCEVEVLGLNVVEGHVVCLEDIDGIEVNAGAGSADGNILALEVSNGLDGGVHGNDLDLLHVQCADNGEILDCAGFLKEVGACISIAHNIGLAECELSVACCEVLNICLGAVADNRGNGSVGLVGSLLCKNSAECVVGACLAAGNEGKVVTAAAARAEGEDHHDCQKHCHNLFHLIFPPVLQYSF